MAWPRFPFGSGEDKEARRAAEAAALERSEKWKTALAHDRLPDFVAARLGEVRDGQTPWTSTMTPAELLLATTRGIRPIATVSGTCWYQYGRSWTEGHAAGWRSAQHRMRAEAKACGANAVVDVKMRTVRGGPDFVRLLQAGVVPVGLAVGARYDWLLDQSKTYAGSWTWNNQPLSTLSRFWETLRREAHSELRADAARMGNGVLAHTHLSQLLRQEGGDKSPDRYLGRHIVLGTVVQAGDAASITRGVQTVIDMCDGPSPLVASVGDDDSVYGLNEQEGPN